MSSTLIAQSLVCSSLRLTLRNTENYQLKITLPPAKDCELAVLYCNLIARFRSMDVNDNGTQSHLISEEDIEEKCQASSETVETLVSDENKANIDNESLFQSSEVSSTDKNNKETNVGHDCRHSNISFNDKNVEVSTKQECQSINNLSAANHGLDIENENEFLVQKNSYISDGGLDINNEPQNQNTKPDMDIERNQECQSVQEQECQSPELPSFGVTEAGHSAEADAIINMMPKLGMEFNSEDHAYEIYNRYAAIQGFSIRKDFVNKNRRNGLVVSRRYTCHKQGYGPIMPVEPRKDPRTGCLAHMTISRQRNDKFRVTRFESKHNHEFATPFTAHLLPSQKKMTFAQAVEAESANNSMIDGVPKLGMGFGSEDHAYEFYNTYAGKVGFSVRKDYVNRSKIDGAVASRRFTCFREGFRQKGTSDSIMKRPRKETRIGCLAQLIIARHSDGKYYVTHFKENHNHELVPQCRVRMLRSQKRLVQAIETNVIDGCSKMQPKSGPELICSLARDQEIFCNYPIDHRSNLPSKRMKDMKQREAESILQHLQSKQLKNPSFFYAIQLDVEEQMTNVFWVDAKMLTDYGAFGDVVCFDTTYRLSKENRPFAPFIGVNYHKQIVIFGAALLYDETVESFIWLFRTFNDAMPGKKPKTILTDQDAMMAEAISLELSETVHWACAWHVYQKALNYLSQACGCSGSFASDLSRCIFHHDEEEDFLNAWKVMLDTHSLWENECLNEIFKERERWAIPYAKHVFCADITTAQLSESFSTNLGRYLKSEVDILNFFKQFGKLANDWRYKEIEANYNMSQHMPRLMGNIIMLKHAREVYTPEIFELFQQEYENCLNFVVNKCTKSASIFEYKVSTYGQPREYTVMYNLLEDSVVCNCMKFQFAGILCSHVLKVLDYRNVKVVPAKYILKRWTRDAKSFE